MEKEEAVNSILKIVDNYPTPAFYYQEISLDNKTKTACVNLRAN